MDKSHRYIELCGHAAEIQQRWVQAYGDFYADESGRITCWLDNPTQCRRMKKGVAIHTEDGVIHLTRYVWMPRQDQLIEMAQVRGRTYDSVTLDFYNWTRTGYGPDAGSPGKEFPSMEQIWLAYVMQRKYFKIWAASAWCLLTSV